MHEAMLLLAALLGCVMVSASFHLAIAANRDVARPVWMEAALFCGGLLCFSAATTIILFGPLIIHRT